MLVVLKFFTGKDGGIQDTKEIISSDAASITHNVAKSRYEVRSYDQKDPNGCLFITEEDLISILVLQE